MEDKQLPDEVAVYWSALNEIDQAATFEWAHFAEKLASPQSLIPEKRATIVLELLHQWLRWYGRLVNDAKAREDRGVVALHHVHIANFILARIEPVCNWVLSNRGAEPARRLQAFCNSCIATFDSVTVSEIIEGWSHFWANASSIVELVVGELATIINSKPVQRWFRASWYVDATAALDKQLTADTLRRAGGDGRIEAWKNGGRHEYEFESVCRAYPHCAEVLKRALKAQ
jgi:hypothetical protein